MRQQPAQSTIDSAHYRVESLTTQHIAGAARVLHEAFPNHVLTALGPGAVREILTSYVSSPGGCAYACVLDDEVVGFVVGTEDARSHRRFFLRTRWLFLLFHVLARIAVTPHLTLRIFRYLRTFLVPAHAVGAQSEIPIEQPSIPTASLAILAVLTEHRRRGVADRLMQTFLNTLRQRGVDRVKLAVSTSNKVAVNFYLARNWKIAGQFPSPEGGSVYRLVYHLT